MALFADLDTPHVQSTPSGVSALISARFPVPPIAWRYLSTPYEGVLPNGVAGSIFGAVFPESKYLEPTIGQIWPR